MFGMGFCFHFTISSFPSFSPGERNRRRRCQVAFSYLPQNEDELELKVGDIIEVVGEVSRFLMEYTCTQFWHILCMLSS